MKLFFTFACILYCSSVLAEELLEVDGYKYLFSGDFKATWFKANYYCRSRGMFLIDVPTDYEQRRLVSLIATLEHPYNQTSYWTSGTDLDKEGEFVWASSGNAFIYTKWDTRKQYNNPSNTYHANYVESENCVELRDEINFNWNDHACHHKMSFICRNTIIPALIIEPVYQNNIRAIF